MNDTELERGGCHIRLDLTDSYLIKPNNKCWHLKQEG